MSLTHDYLAQRGVTDPDVIAARGYEDVDEGIRIPLYAVSSASTDGEAYGHETRLIPPKIIKGKETKFIRPKGQDQLMSVNPMYFERPAEGKPLWIVEGTIRADALHQRGVNSVLSLTSCWGWRNQRHGSDPQLDELALRGKEVWLWFDGDIMTKRLVNLAGHKFAAVLESRGALVRFGIVPNNEGLDDYLAKGNDVSSLRMLLVDDLPLVEDPAMTEDQFREGTELPRTSDAALARDWLSQTSDVCHVNGEWWAHVAGKWQQAQGGSKARTRLLPYLERLGEQFQEIGDASGSTRQQAFGRKMRQELESSGKGTAVLMQGLAVEQGTRSEDEFDKDPYLLNLANGTLNLRTREFYSHRPEDMLTGISPTVYDPNATAPAWQRFLDSALPDKDVQTYLRRMLGATLPGMTLSQRVLVFSGRTRAGKGTAIRALFAVLGRDFSGELRREVIMKSSRSSSEHQTQVMWLKGRRLASVNETNEGEEFDAAKLKTLSGGDEITARGMYQDQTTFKPTHNLILSTNALPNVDSSDLALWGRLRVIPFRQSFLGHEDETLDERLQMETSGILNWLLDGLKDYEAVREGEIPKDVDRAKSDWQEAGDSVASFAKDILGQAIPKDGRLTRGDMRARYDEWCHQAEVEPVGPNTGKFKTGLEAKGFREYQVKASVDPKRPRYWTHDNWGDVAQGNRVVQTSTSGTGRGTGLEPDVEPGLTCVEPDELDGLQTLLTGTSVVTLRETLAMINNGRARMTRQGAL